MAAAGADGAGAQNGNGATGGCFARGPMMRGTTWPWNLTAGAPSPRNFLRRGGCFTISLLLPGGRGNPRNPD
eukprot:7115526-Lingulodinium_polyedra.AAC.1